jgi:Tol biopolymer transport system component
MMRRTGAGNSCGHQYSPDGEKIAFYSQGKTGVAAILMMNSDGSDLKKVSPDYAWRFDWSPDGQKFVFLYLDYLKARPGNGELWLINVDGTGLRQLTHFQRNLSQEQNKEGITMNLK